MDSFDNLAMYGRMLQRGSPLLQVMAKKLLLKLLIRSLISGVIALVIYTILLIYFPFASLSYIQVIMGLILLRCIKWYLR